MHSCHFLCMHTKHNYWKKNINYNIYVILFHFHFRWRFYLLETGKKPLIPHFLGVFFFFLLFFGWRWWFYIKLDDQYNYLFSSWPPDYKLYSIIKNTYSYLVQLQIGSCKNQSINNSHRLICQAQIKSPLKANPVKTFAQPLPASPSFSISGWIKAIYLLFTTEG